MATLAIAGSLVGALAGTTVLAPTAAAATTAAAVPGSTPSGAAAFEGPVRTVVSGGITFGYRQFGQGRPLVMIMGTNGTLAFWQWQLMSKLAAAGFRVTAFDNQGVGYSTDTTVPLTVQGMARNDIGLIRTLGLKKPTVVGWSMGGEIALSMAALYPKAIGTVISSGGDAGSSHYVETSAKNLQEFFNGTAAQLVGLVFSPPGPRSQAAAASWVASLALYPSEIPSAQIQARQAASFTRFRHSDQIWNRLPSITNKVILTNGAEDELNAPANAKLIAAHIPGSVAILFPNSGHGMLFQDQVRFVRVVKHYG